MLNYQRVHTNINHINYLQVIVGFLPKIPMVVAGNGCFPQIGFFGSPPWHQMAHGCWALGPGHGAMAVVTKKGWDDRMGFQFLFFFSGGNLGFVFVFFRMGIFCQHSDIIRCWSAVDCNAWLSVRTSGCCCCQTYRLRMTCWTCNSWFPRNWILRSY